MQLTQSLADMKDFEASVDVTVTLPMAADDEVNYTVDLASADAPADTLSPVSFIIDWTLPAPSGVNTGFTAYFNGNLYRYRHASKLQEYHADSNPDPFLSLYPVQNTTQFREILPVALADEINGMMTDSTWTLAWTPDTLFRATPVAMIRARRRVDGVEAANSIYVFQPHILSPLYVEKEMSPGQISEQTVAYTYRPARRDIAIPVSESQLMELYPEEFARYREGAYALNSLKGRQLPSFSLPATTGDRYSRSAADAFQSPVILAFIDETVATTPQLIADVRNAIDRLPANVDVKWIFLSNRTDDILPLITPRAGEQILFSGRNIAPDFGITATPALIFVTPDAKVADIQAGYNNNMVSIVINKTAPLFFP